MDVDAMMSNTAFASLTPVQKEAFKQLIIRLEGKTIAEAMPVMLSFMASAPKAAPLSAAEQQAMTEAVIASLNEADRAKFKALLALASKR